MSEARKVLIDPLVDNNPVTLQMLGICSALAVTTSLLPALLMCVALTSVAALAGAAISALRHRIPNNIRIIVHMTIIASLVILVDQLLKAYAFETSKQLSVFVGLIITNCIVLGRAEAFAMKNGVVMSFLDGLGNGLGYSLILIAVATLRELFGAGTLLGYPILELDLERRLVRGQRPDAAAAERVLHHRPADLGHSHLAQAAGRETRLPDS